MMFRNLPGTKKRGIKKQDAKAEAIRAFRTITTMLSLLQSDSRTVPTDDGSNVGSSRKELKILNALATVVIREYGVSAVVAEPYDQSGNIQVLASLTYHNRVERPLVIPQPSSSKNISDYLSKFLYVQNPGPLEPRFVQIEPWLRRAVRREHPIFVGGDLNGPFARGGGRGR
jgi:hypothetical protein